jgi:cobalt-zinc-cadmium resistance protein CzcA
MRQITYIYFFFVICFISNVTAQTHNPKNYNLSECIDIALKNNENIKTAGFNIEYRKEIKKTSSDIPKTIFLYTQGQFNSIYKYDNVVSVTQAVPNPLVFKSLNSLAKSQVKSSEYKFDATKADLIFQLKTSYYSLLYSNAVNEVLLTEDSIYNSFAKVVSEKYANGHATLLEKITAETQLMDTKNQVIESEEDINNFQIQLQTLMHVGNNVDAIDVDFDKDYLTVVISEDSVSLHPLLNYYKQQIEVNDKTKTLAKANGLPDFSVGYFNQSIYGPANIYGDDYFLTTKNRLQGFTAGLAIPLWYYPQRSKIKAADINTKLAESDYNYNTSMLSGQYKQAITMYLKYRNSIKYFKDNVLENLEVILTQAIKAYNSKEISYVEYLQVVENALTIKMNYLNVVHQNNLNAIKIEYLLSK